MAAPPVPRIFISYASDDAAWKDNFTRPKWFGGVMGLNVELIDYQIDGGAPFGPLKQWLAEQVESAAAMVCIVSKSYAEKKFTLEEWWKALEDVGRRNLIFVPVMTDARSRAWWEEQKKLGKL